MNILYFNLLFIINLFLISSIKIIDINNPMFKVSNKQTNKMISIDFDSETFQKVLDRNCFETREKWREFTKVNP